MRDPNRIQTFCNELANLWRKVPDWRFGQFISNVLGAYVHTNRLQYVEFFGKFYDGGGEPFVPFEVKSKYIDVKEEA